MLLSKGIGVAFLTKGKIPEQTLSLLRNHAGIVRAQIGIITADETKQAIKNGVTRLSKMAVKDALQIGGDQPLEDLIPMSATTTDPVAVVDEDERLIGEVRHTDVLLGIAGEESGSEEESSKKTDSEKTEKQS